MSTTTHPDIEAPVPAAVLSLRLLRRLHACAPEFSISLGLLVGWARHEIEDRNLRADEAQQVDDPIEAERATIKTALRNDPPATRRRVLRALAEAHRRSEALAKQLRTPTD
ncbi:MAG: hypothetical protein RJA36_3839 [Pseudomonadota bacterium]|jgi:hypothetical protein